MTLVIVERATPVQTLWARLGVETIEEAVRALAEREGANWTGSIGRWPLGQRQHRYAEEVGAWAREKGIDGVVWTDLKAGFREQRGLVPTLDQVLRYLGTLTGEDREAAAEYIARAPIQITTPYRPELERLLGIDEI